MSSAVATTAMTIFMNLTALVTGKNLYVLRILAGMLIWNTSTNPKQGKLIAAFVVHYAIGILFAIGYWALRNSTGYAGYEHEIEPLMIGVLSGFIGISGWTIFVKIHPAPNPTVPWPNYLLVLFIAHILFAFILLMLVELCGSNS